MMQADLATYPPPPGGDWERQRVTELRNRRVPWPHIARQVGRNEIDLRRIYDQPDPPPVIPEPIPLPVTKPTPHRTPKPANDNRNPDGLTTRALVLVLMTAGDITVPELAERMQWAPVVAKAVMGDLVRCGFAQRATRQTPYSTWRITDSGKERLPRMTARRRVPKTATPAQSLPNRVLALINLGETTSRKVASALKVETLVARSVVGKLHHKGFIEAVKPKVWRITQAGVEKLARARK